VSKLLRPLLVLHADPQFVSDVGRAAGKQYQVRHALTWSALRAMTREAPPGAVIVDPYAEAEPNGPAPALEAFLRDFSYVPVIAALETRTGFRDLLLLARWGLSEVISLDQETLSEAVRQRLRAIEGWGLRSALRRSIPRDLPGPAASILFAAAQVAALDGNTISLAATFGVSRRTITRWCERAVLPPPRRLLAWMRLLFAAELLDDWNRKVYQIALATGYSSDNALRTALEAFLARTPKELRGEGAFATVSACFWDELRQFRQARGSGGVRRRTPTAGSDRLGGPLQG
jgi:AraC-like DNA-binding protein